MVKETVTLGDVVGDGLQYHWDNTKLGIKTESEIEYTYTELKGESLILEVEDNVVKLRLENDEQYKIITLNGLDYLWDGTKLGVKNTNENTYNYVDLKGATGPYFQPVLTPQGDEVLLSWTNTGGLTNPETMNIRGFQGLKGETGTVLFDLEKADTFAQLPTTGTEGIIYIVPNNSGEDNNIFDEYLWSSTTNGYEHFGGMSVDISGKANSSDVYLKTEVYSKTEISTNYYSKTEIDSLLSLKADKTDTYTKSDVDTLINVIPQLNDGSDVDLFNDPFTGSLSDFYGTTTGLEYTTKDTYPCLHATSDVTTSLKSGYIDIYRANCDLYYTGSTALVFKVAVDSSNYLSFSFTASTGAYSLVQDVAGTITTLLTGTNTSMIPTTWFNILFTLKGTSFVVNVNGVSLTATVNDFKSGTFNLTLPSGAYCKALRIYSSTKDYIDIGLGNLNELDSSTVTLLGGS